jgi:hypothetical protein
MKLVDPWGTLWGAHLGCVAGEVCPMGRYQDSNDVSSLTSAASLTCYAHTGSGAHVLEPRNASIIRLDLFAL